MLPNSAMRHTNTKRIPQDLRPTRAKMTTETRPISWIVKPPDEPIFSELATEVRIVDEAAGEFVVVKQDRSDPGEIAIEPSEWPTLRDAIDNAVRQCAERKP